MRLFLITFTLFLFANASQAFATNPPAEVGLAVFYEDNYHGRKTASGDVYNKEALTAAHKTLPFGSKVRVTHLESGRSVDVTINDRGPYIKGQIILVSHKAAEILDILKEGEAKVKVEVITGPDNAPVASKDEKNKANEKKATPAPAKPKEPELTILQEAAEIQTGGLYKMQVLKLEPKGFGVQVAGYSDYESVVKQIAALQKNWFKGSMVFVDELNGKPYYKVILGPFFTKEEADSYCENIRKKYNLKDAFVVEIDKMKVTTKK